MSRSSSSAEEESNNNNNNQDIALNERVKSAEAMDRVKKYFLRRARLHSHLLSKKELVEYARRNNVGVTQKQLSKLRSHWMETLIARQAPIRPKAFMSAMPERLGNKRGAQRNDPLCRNSTLHICRSCFFATTLPPLTVTKHPLVSLPLLLC